MIPTIIITAVIAILFVAIIVRGIKKRKNGGGCGCGCGGCAMSDICHEKKE